MSTRYSTTVELKGQTTQLPTPEAFAELVAQCGLAESFHIPSAVRERLQSQLGLDTTSLLHLCMKMVQPRAVAPVSNFHVGAAALGESGDVHMGVNLEFQNNPLTNTMHAEQFLVIGCLQRGETKLVEIATSAPPCGYCRQFLNEMTEGSKMVVCCQTCTESASSMGSRYTLAELLPKSFGPADLFPVKDTNNDIFSRSRHNSLHLLNNFQNSNSGATLAEAAVAAANRSYCPYSHNAAGVALRTSDGCVHSGWSVENAAYNPTLSPLHGAIVAMMCSGSFGSDSSMGASITECVLVEGLTQAGLDQRSSSNSENSTGSSSSMWHATVVQVMASLAPGASVRMLHAAVAVKPSRHNNPTDADNVSPQEERPILVERVEKKKEVAVIRTPNLSALPHSQVALCDWNLATMSPIEGEKTRRLSEIKIRPHMTMDTHGLIAPQEKMLAKAQEQEQEQIVPAVKRQRLCA